MLLILKYLKAMIETKKKRILIFSLVYYPNFIGGAEVAIKEITDRLGDPKENSYDFDMVTLRLDSHLPKVERVGNVTVHRVGWVSSHGASPDSLPWWVHINKYTMLGTAFFKALSLHRKNKYDATWSMMATYNSFAALFFKYTYPKVPFLLTLQEGDPIPFIKKRARPLWPLFVSIFKKADSIQAISHYLADFARDMGAKCPIIVVPNAVDVAHFAKDYSESDINAAKEKLGKKEGDIFLITTSRMVTKNAVEDIIAAMPLLPGNVKLVVAGRGYLEQTLRKQAEMLGLMDRVIFYGFLPHSEMPLYLKACDIFIRVPISEGFGNSYPEAMAAGIPVIATPVGGIVDFLKDRETGIFAKVRDHQSIADAVMTLIKDEVLVSKIKRQAFEMVKEKYDWEIVTEEMKKIFTNLQ